VGVGALAVLAAIAAAWLIPRLDVPPRFWLSPISDVRIADRRLRVVHVDYASGLRHVDSLGGLDGALFQFERPLPIQKGMGMAGTLIPLDVVFFDADGRAIDRFTMPVCTAMSGCPGYFPRRPWQFAIEAPAGALTWVDEGAPLRR
jgi:uncharacterized membrane protein (UPF0127 family)